MATLPDTYGRRPTPQDRARFVNVSDQSRTGQAMGQLAGQVAQIGDEYQKQQDIAAVSAARRALDDWERSAIFDPEKGAINRRGQDAFGVPDALREDFDKTAGKVSESLKTERQRRAFQEMADGRRGQVLDWAAKHAGRERESFDEGQYQADVKSFQDRAALFPDKAPAELAMMQQRTIGYLRSKGRSTEEINAAMRDNTDKAHASVLSSLLSGGQDAEAVKYFDANKAGMQADTVARSEAAIKQAVTLTAAQRNADEVIGKGLPMDQALAETREKFKGDGKAAELAVNQVKTRYAERDLAVKQAEQSSYEAARLHVERGQQIPFKVWNGMDDGHRADILASQRGRAEALEAKARGREVKTDWPTYLRLRDFAGTDPEKFMAEDLGKYAGHIGGAQLEQLQDLKDRLADPKKQRDSVSLQQQVTAAVKSLKLSGKQGEEKAGQLQTAISNAIFAAEEAKGKALTAPERQKEIDRLLIHGEVESGSWWKSDPDVRLYEIAGDPTQRAKFAPTISDADRATIVQRFEARGVKKPTPDQIMQAYKAWKKL